MNAATRSPFVPLPGHSSAVHPVNPESMGGGVSWSGVNQAGGTVIPVQPNHLYALSALVTGLADWVDNLLAAFPRGAYFPDQGLAHEYNASTGQTIAFGIVRTGSGGVFTWPQAFQLVDRGPAGTTMRTLHGEPKMNARNVTLQGPRGNRTYLCPHGRVVGDISECYGHDAHIHYGPNAPGHHPAFIGQDRQSFRYDHKKLSLAAPPTGTTQPGGSSVDIVAGEQYSVTVYPPPGSSAATIGPQVVAAFTGGAASTQGGFVDASVAQDGSMMTGIVVSQGAGTFTWPQSFQLVDQGTGSAAGGIMGWWAGLSTMMKVAVGVGAAAVVGGGGYLLLKKGKKGSRGGRRKRSKSSYRRAARKGRRRR